MRYTASNRRRVADRDHDICLPFAIHMLPQKHVLAKAVVAKIIFDLGKSALTNWRSDSDLAFAAVATDSSAFVLSATFSSSAAAAFFFDRRGFFLVCLAAGFVRDIGFVFVTTGLAAAASPTAVAASVSATPRPTRACGRAGRFIHICFTISY